MNNINIDKMNIRMNRLNIFRYSFIALGVLLFTGLISCTPSNNDKKQAPRLPAQQQNQVQNNNGNTESPASVNIENTEQKQNENNTGAMLNPPHGQPGHRCEIPVGSPLNTPAVAPARQPATTGTTVAAQSVPNSSMSPTIENANRMNTPKARTAVAPATGTKPANNPPHGQPWHRCDIAVGSPLP